MKRYTTILILGAIFATGPSLTAAEWVFDPSPSAACWVFTESAPTDQFDPFGTRYAPPISALKAFNELAEPVEETPIDVLAQCPGGPNGQCPIRRYSPPVVSVTPAPIPRAVIEPLDLRESLNLFVETATLDQLNRLHSAAHNGPALMQGPPGWEREHVRDHIRDANQAALRRMASSVGLIASQTIIPKQSAIDDRRYAKTYANRATPQAANVGPIRRLIQRQPVRSFFRRIRSRLGGC